MTLADVHKHESTYPGVLKGLDDAAYDLQLCSDVLKAAFRVTGNQLALRAELMLEELAELFRAMHDNDEIKALDAIADLLYVVYGTATQFDLPAAAGFWEAHRSNMSKGKQAATHSGDRGKGDGYIAPCFGLILQAHRDYQAEKIKEDKAQQRIDFDKDRDHA